MEVTRHKQGAAVIIPIRRETTSSPERVAIKTKSDILELMNEQASLVSKLSKEYADTKSERLRNQMNTENLHLHGQIHVLWSTFTDWRTRILEENSNRGK